MTSGPDVAPLIEDTQTERSPRKRLSLAVSLLVQGEELTGYCLNVSNSGMLILLPEEMPSYLVWSLGHLAGVVEDSRFRIKIRVARVDEERVGVAFQISHADDRELIRSLLEAAGPERPADSEHNRISGLLAA